VIFLIDRFTLFVNNISVKHTHLGDKPMDPRGNGEVRRPRFGDLRFRQSTAAVSSLNEAWFHILDEYVIDTPLNEVLLPLLRNCFFGGAVYALLLLQRVMAISSLAISPASSPKSRSRDLPGLQIPH